MLASLPSRFPLSLRVLERCPFSSGPFRVYSMTILAYYPSKLTGFALEQVTFVRFQFNSMFTKTS